MQKNKQYIYTNEQKQRRIQNKTKNQTVKSEK